MPFPIQDAFKQFMDQGQIIYHWKQVYWRAIGEGKEPQQAAEIANQHVAHARDPVPAVQLSPVYA